MTRTALAMALLLCGIGPDRADAQAAPAGAAPRDIREVFLALPVPAAAPGRPVLSRVASRISTRQRRQEALERGLASPSGETVLDVRNGYLDLCVLPPGEGDCVASVVVTYFVRGNGERLVVMQAVDLDPWGVEADFWGDQPPPRGLPPRVLRQVSALVVQWPQTGTTARAHVHPYFEGVEDKDHARTLADLHDQGLFASFTLVWDRGRGVFTRGKRELYMPEEDHDH